MRLPVRQPVRLGVVRGLVLWLKFDEGTGLKAYDLSQYRNHGTIHGATWTQGKFGKALSFDGVDDYVEVPDSASLDITDEITIEAWVNVREKDGEQYPVQKHGAYGMFVRTDMYNGGFWWNIWWEVEGPEWKYVNNLNPLFLNKWCHLVWTFDGTYVKSYVNGELKGTWDRSGRKIAVSAYPLYVGQSGGGSWFNGTIDEVRIYNRALSEEEIKRLYWQVVRIMRDLSLIHISEPTRPY